MMRELHDFCQTLLAHIANDKKTTHEHVKAKYHVWSAKQDEVDNIEFLTSQHYRVTVDQPRNDRSQAYNDYVLAKAQLWEAWKTAHREQRSSILHEIAQLHLPQMLEEGIEPGIPVYTKNIQVL